jgi:hypothetical protein
MKKLLFCFVSVYFLSTFGFAQTKYALLIGVGNYPERSIGGNWSDLSSKNDIDLVKDMLLTQKFDKKNIEELLDEKATVSNVMKSLENLMLKLKAGDIVYLHYSGHGQQIADWDSKDYPKVKFISKDEGEDGYDEAFVLYNAPMEHFDGYTYEEHLIDDQLDYYVSSIESKIGDKGHVVVVLDACHSGSGTRGAEPTKKRGSSTKCAPKTYRPTLFVDDNKGFTSKSAVGNGMKAIFMGCKNEEVNYEMSVNGTGYGSLTYSIVEAISGLKSTASYKNVYDLVYGKLLINSAGKQHAEELFDDANSLFFGGENVPMSDYYDVLSSVSNIVAVRAGVIQGISVGDSISFFPIDPSQSKGVAVSKGIVTKVEGAKCIVTLNSKLPLVKKDDYALFKAKRSYEVITGQQLKLALDLTNKETIKIVKNALKDEKNILIVDPKQDAPNYYLKEVSDKKVRIEIPLSGNPLRAMRLLSMDNKNDVDTLVEHLKIALRIDYFTNLEMSDENIDVKVNLILMSDTALLEYIEREYGDKAEGYKGLRGYNFVAENNSIDKVYLHGVYISNNKVIEEIDLNKRDDENKFISLIQSQKLTINQTKPIITGCIPDLDCGVDRIYFFASQEKMDFSAIEELAKSLATRGSEDSFVKLISDGAAGKNQSANSISGVQLIKYEISVNP